MPAPTVVTSPATAISATEATLNGTVDPNALLTDYWFEYWRNDWEAAGEPFRENLCTNPVGGAGATTGWAKLGLTTLEAVESLPTLEGLPSGVTTGFHGVGDGNTHRTEFSYAVTKDEPVSVSLYVRLASLSATELRVRTLRESGFAAGVLGNVTTVGGSFARIDVQYTADATGTDKLQLEQIGAGAVDFHYTAALIEQSATLGSFFPRPHHLASGQAVFTGTEHASSSKLATPTDSPEAKEGDAGEGEVAKAVSEEVEGLEDEVEYHFRAYASNEDGESFGGDETFVAEGGVVGALGFSGLPLSRRNRIVNP